MDSAVVQEYAYVYNGGTLAQMTGNGQTLSFAYDGSGKPMTATWNGTTYLYLTNIQGDVIAILDTDGNIVVQYTYDAWGNILTTTGTLAETLGAINPLTYRGYVFDQETRLYYLQSRFYNPEIGRFINADALVATGQGLLGNNMSAYCNNNPANLLDPYGTACVACVDDNSFIMGGGVTYQGGGGGMGLALSIVAVGVVAELLESSHADAKTSQKAPSSGEYTVYFLYAKGDPYQNVVYVGRVKTENFDARMSYHDTKGRALKEYISGLSYEACRAFEQAGMAYYHTINRNNPLNNQIRGISPTNVKRYTYIDAVLALIENGLYPQQSILPASYWANFAENEFLNLI